MQKQFFNAIKMLGLVVLIALAVMGVGLTGGALAIQPRRRPLDPEIKIELVEKKKDDTKGAKQLDHVKQ